MTGERITDVAVLDAPFGRQVTLKGVVHESGLRLLRITIKEGRRITILEVDEATAKQWSKAMSDWAHQAET